MSDRLRSFLVVLVGVGWFLNLTLPAVISSYESSLIANGPLLLILGAAFTVKGKKDKSDDQQ